MTESARDDSFAVTDAIYHFLWLPRSTTSSVTEVSSAAQPLTPHLTTEELDFAMGTHHSPVRKNSQSAQQPRNDLGSPTSPVPGSSSSDQQTNSARGKSTIASQSRSRPRWHTESLNLKSDAAGPEVQQVQKHSNAATRLLLDEFDSKGPPANRFPLDGAPAAADAPSCCSLLFAQSSFFPTRSCSATASQRFTTTPTRIRAPSNESARSGACACHSIPFATGFWRRGTPK